MSEMPEFRAIKWLVFGSLILMCANGLRGKPIKLPSCHVPVCGFQDTTTTEGKGNKKQIQFKILLTGEFEDENKVHLATTNYLASDGVGLTVIHNQFPSAATAQEYFEKVLAKALKVSERGDKKDKAGKIVGKRATAIIPTGKPIKPFRAILLTYGPDFYEIESVSSRHNRIMEIRLTSSN
jgi:hypothetical protein